MLQILKNWYDEHFSDPQVVILALLLIGGFAFVIVWGDALAPVLASVVVAYLLEGLVSRLQWRGLPRLLAAGIVFVIFFAFLVFVLVGLLPLISRQATQLIGELPSMITRTQELLLRLPEKYPEFITVEQVQELSNQIRIELGSIGREVLSVSLASVTGIITVVVYLILVPVLVFFFMKDKERIIGWFTHFLPENYSLAARVWKDVDRQIGNYVRGKFWEILIVWWASYVTFSLLGLNFGLLLSALVGVSVLVPYIGAAVVTFPVAIVAYFQWGLTPDFWMLFGAYLVIQVLDGNALVPLLFSEVVNLHPIAIIVAVLFFGSLWGFWGVFFAIPLATLVQAVLDAWPRPATIASAAAGEVSAAPGRAAHV